MPFTSPPTAVTGDVVDEDYTNIFAENDAWFNGLIPAPTAADQVLIASGTAAASWGTIGSSNLASGGITGDLFVPGSLTAAKFASGAVGIDKLTTALQAYLLQTSLKAFVRTAAEIPSGWTRDTNMSGRFPVSAGTVSTQVFTVNTAYGVGWGHAHEVDIDSGEGGGTRNREEGDETDAPADTHWHYIRGTTSSTAWMPPSRAYVFMTKS